MCHRQTDRQGDRFSEQVLDGCSTVKAISGRTNRLGWYLGGRKYRAVYPADRKQQMQTYCTLPVQLYGVMTGLGHQNQTV